MEHNYKWTMYSLKVRVREALEPSNVFLTQIKVWFFLHIEGVHFLRINVIKRIMNLLKHTWRKIKVIKILNHAITSFGFFPWGFLFLFQDFLLNFSLFIELVEVIDNDRDGEGDAEDSTDGAARSYLDNKSDIEKFSSLFLMMIVTEMVAQMIVKVITDQLAEPSFRVNVAITHRCHGDDGPIERLHSALDQTKYRLLHDLYGLYDL